MNTEHYQFVYFTSDQSLALNLTEGKDIEINTHFTAAALK